MKLGKPVQVIVASILVVLISVSCQRVMQRGTVAWDRVEFPNDQIFLAVSPDLQWFAYQDLSGRVMIGKATREGGINPVAVIGRGEVLGFSPDSTKIAVVEWDWGPTPTHAKIWVMNVPDIQHKKMIYEGERVYNLLPWSPSWSPNNRWIAITGADWQTRVVDIMEGKVLPGMVPAAPYGKFRAYPFAWCSDGNRILYVEDSTLWEMEVASGERHIVTLTFPLVWGNPFCSPDGAYIALVGGWSKEGQERVTIQEGVTILDKQYRRILSLEVPLTHVRPWGCWSPDGKKFAFPFSDPRIHPWGEGVGVIIMPGGEVRFFPPGGGDKMIGWAPDSRGIIINRDEDGKQVLIRLLVGQK